MAFSFSLAKTPSIYCGVGTLCEITGWLFNLKAQSVMLVTGSKSLRQTGKLNLIEEFITKSGASYKLVKSDGEPTVERVDDITERFFGTGIDAVISVGGGSVIDLGKAVSAMLPYGNSVMDHLEGVGKGFAHPGGTLPYLAIPTTSGTGGEVSKNAVLSRVGPAGFKKSLRHDNFVPSAVILDGDLLTSADASVTAACGMDAFTQLLEPYFSTAASPMTDAIVWSGLEHLIPNLLPACGDGAHDPSVRLQMAYAALCSGIGLANAGLGIVHGLAGPIGGKHPIPHGVICGTLIASAQRQNWDALKQRAPEHPTIHRMARVGRMMPGGFDLKDDYAAVDHFTEELENWVEMLGIPRLGCFDIKDSDLDLIVQESSNRHNPIELTDSEIRSLLERRC